MRGSIRSLVASLLLLVAMAGWAADDDKVAGSARAELATAFEAARPVAQHGPVDIALRDQATLHMPAGFTFIPAKESAAVLRAMGNRTGDNLLGMIWPAKEDTGFLVLQYIKSGYIKDDDAKEWNADDMLANLKAGTEEANSDRKSRGIPEMEITGWVERPTYDAGAHQLKWSVASKDKGASDSGDKGINYNTYALGREGFISMNLVTDLNVVESQKPLVSKLLSGLAFGSGKGYVDFNASTDHMAEFGLAALIGGVAAKKLGLLALAGVFIAKFFKVIMIGLVALAAGWARYFRKKPAAPAPVAMSGGSLPEPEKSAEDPTIPKQG